MEPLLTPSDVAKVLRVHISTVYSLAATGDLESVNVGKRKGVRFEPNAVRAFIDNRKSRPKVARVRLSMLG